MSPLGCGQRSWILILGIQGIVYGAVGVFRLLKGLVGGAAILGAISILFGIILLSNVWIATFSLPWVLGIFGIAGGIMAIVSAFRLC
ncbi:MAG: hypothetical protein M5U34_11890 [Chloroflexi bacterium]|nr:hypothetical protein [Chloroflexota bacterium]